MSCFPDASTVAEAFTWTATRVPARPFLQVLPETASAYGIPPGEISYAQMAERIGTARRAYAAAGYGAGHRIGLMVENRPAFFVHWLALNGLGTSVVPLSTELRPAELGYLVQHSEIVLGVAVAAHLDRLRAVASGLPVIDDATAPPPASSWARGMPAGRGDECALLYTSGTTGRPKGCVLSNRYFLNAAQWYAGLDALAALRDGDRLITPLPLGHMNAMAFSATAMMAVGGCLVQLDRFHPRSWWESVRQSRATVLHYLGVMPSMLLSASPDPRDRDHAVRFGFGAGVDRGHHAAFEQRFGFPLLEAWAMTETGAGAVVIANREPRHVGTSCFGRPSAAMEIAFAEDGEFLVRAVGSDPRAGFFTEYLKDERATAEAWQDGWFHTGDIVQADADGSLRFVDRKKNIIRRSGENISAAEVESVLRGHPVVAEVAVAAAPDPVREEEVLACIVPRAALADQQASAQDIVRTALRDLSYFKVPGWIAFVDQLPLTASQKVARGELKVVARRLLDGGGCIDTRGLKRR
jgi:acyl-CoA synthetase (AMP-forming)/AMP-acid ligase II